jgi:hypothetical protein
MSVLSVLEAKCEGKAGKAEGSETMVDGHIFEKVGD